MHFINDQEIRSLISMKDIIDTIEDYYLNDGEKKSLVPERLFINDDDNSALLMPSFYEDYYGAKLIGIAPGNATIGEATLRGIFLLNDRKTMKPLAIMDARTITAMRTGAVSGLGMKYLAANDTETIGVIGTGDQGWSHLQAACAVRSVMRVLVYNRSKERLDNFMEKAKGEFPTIRFEISDPEIIVKEAQIIITTTTSKSPVVPYDGQIELTGKHFAGSGAFKSFMQEIPDSIIKEADHIFADTHAAFSECGEMINARKFGHSEETIPELKTLVQRGENEEMKQKITVFKSVGISIFDILTAKLIYERYQSGITV
ncbi:ornithine cyclodeaminase family protein [Sporosarcina sp. JAI121]|uniref:ornithine cyclodeaminase family protein n=1 Tax=Sporosarcina sp. JAI121 TaxID=2723064 RepID=UPI0015C6AC09|nr:ornithine cyclodeaminase family protein [Sporosarcina sp. JAI121]NYF25633.1 ornithine cyclodeaminase/alanine dehydrogenase-like protein (mu-crystallin family) [Sporosarcina sp. JAI121]